MASSRMIVQRSEDCKRSKHSRIAIEQEIGHGGNVIRIGVGYAAVIIFPSAPEHPLREKKARTMLQVP